ncbi:MAG: YtxH domain-containing protein [Aliarcobacter sp.]|nr:YtxH domain-containing protein [Aliarcobacter sp.]
MNNNYDINIENTRPKNIQTGVNINQNPYINQIQNPAVVVNPTTQSGFNNGDFIKGALLGALATYLLTNKNAQETIMKTVGKGSELFSAGIEELKERYEDAKAQMQANQER